MARVVLPIPMSTVLPQLNIDVHKGQSYAAQRRKTEPVAA
jgi:hypothetical protein